MHRFERFRDPLPAAQNSIQGRTETWIGARPVVDQMQIVPDQLVGGARQLHAMSLAIGENASAG